EDGRPAKRAKLGFMDGSDDDSSEEITLNVNEDYAKRFEHNKKREELARCKALESSESEEESSSDESEDDEGELATADLDAEISATLNAIRSKDPRVYDTNVTFYSEFDPDKDAPKEKKEKPITLADYHRKNLMEGKAVVDEDEDAPPRTYQQQQDSLKNDLVKEMHAAASGDEDSGDDFLVRKPGQVVENGASEAPAKKVDLKVEEADKDPENFLSNFMAARAWVTDGPAHAPLESDDEEEERRAEEFEQAYNMRFEDPATANEKLMTHARDAVAKQTVRREELSGRKKQRELQRQRKEAEKKEREEEKARFRRLKIEEMEEKIAKIKEAAGLSGKGFKMEEWADVLEQDWDDDRWDQEMQRRFGEDYYEEADNGMSDEETADGKKKPKKPTWDDDIDIKDIAPDFTDDEAEKPVFSLSDDDEDGGVELPDEDAEIASKKKPKNKKDREKEKAAAKADSRRERRLIETLVDQNLPINLATASSGTSTSKAATRFRYRETSPTSFGLTARDILLADDLQLNQFAGLKKMAPWRDEEKKRRDRKKLGKKARLREWRREVFGDEAGPNWEVLPSAPVEKEEKKGDVEMKDADAGAGAEEGGVDIRDGKKKKKRSKKRKAAAVE
ncbi:Krr1-domain-containing protein, partial [Saccharata proteae CBS 121410]